MKRALRAKVHALAPSVLVGKSGLTQGIAEEVKQRLKRERLVKVKFLPSAVAGRDKKALAGELAEKTGARVVHAVGFVVTLARRKKE